jgi:hypothetical protein
MGVAERYARATSGHAAALPRPAMNSRRRIRNSLKLQCGQPIPAEVPWELAAPSASGAGGASDPGDARRPENGGSRGGWPVTRLRRPGLPDDRGGQDREWVRLLRSATPSICEQMCPAKTDASAGIALSLPEADADCRAWEQSHHSPRHALFSHRHSKHKR